MAFRKTIVNKETINRFWVQKTINRSLKLISRRNIVRVRKSKKCIIWVKIKTKTRRFSKAKMPLRNKLLKSNNKQKLSKGCLKPKSETTIGREIRRRSMTRKILKEWDSFLVEVNYRNSRKKKSKGQKMKSFQRVLDHIRAVNLLIKVVTKMLIQCSVPQLLPHISNHNWKSSNNLSS